jgi:hypothetical protein
LSSNLPVSSGKTGLEAAIQAAIAVLPGRWDVTISMIAGTWTVSVIGPDGSRWSMSCVDPGSVLNREAIADDVGAACRRRLARKRGNWNIERMPDRSARAASVTPPLVLGSGPKSTNH